MSASEYSRIPGALGYFKKEIQDIYTKGEI
jgi:hypothetical protein